METANKKRPSGETARPFYELGMWQGRQVQLSSMSFPAIKDLSGYLPSRSTPTADPSSVTFRKIILKDNDKELSKDKRPFL